MDVAKLDKMKVVDLRNELQTRGLDTKGVKAVLIERLRAHVDGGGAGDGDGAPVTPSRRQRRTRSMSRSPSPVAAAPVATEPELETLEEEDQAGEPAAAAEKPQSESDIEAEADSAEPEAEDTVESETANAEEKPQAREPEANDEAETEEADEATTVIGQEADEPMEQAEDDANDGNEALQPLQAEQAVPEEAAEVPAEKAEPATNGDSQKMDVDEEETPAAAKAEEEQEKSEDQPHERRKRSHSRSRSRSGSRSPKHRNSGGEKREPKPAAEERTVPEDEPTIEENKVGLSWLDSDLHLRIDPTTFASAKPLTSEIYSLIWSGARANYGVRDGKVCFEVRLAEESQPENSHHFRDEPHVRGFRVGFSKPTTSLLLGEAEHSFGYCETGRKANKGEFVDYGKPYQLDDVIGCYLDLESEPCTIKYTLNGEDLGVAFEFEKSILGEEEALFPHIVTKGYEYTVNFSDGEQLLVNAERPTRKRRKHRKEEDKDDDKDDNDGEKWKVLDEATADDDEVEKKDDDAKTSSEKADEEDSDKREKSEEEEKPAPKVETEAEAEAEITTEDVEKKPEATETVETAEPSSTEASGETEAVSNGDANAEKASEEAPSEEQKSSTANDEEDDDGPSPNKRIKTDEDSEKTETAKEKEEDKSQSRDDEYEEVVPEPRDTVALLSDYVLIGLVAVEQLIAGPQRAGSRKECEVILLVGLPGAGKTHWTHKQVADNADKRYEVIGPDSIIAKMTIDGASRKTVHKGRWDKVLEICLNSLGALEDIAMKRRRNFILDQPTSLCPRWSLAGSMT
ncbi:heterogeneous nuclear ribonucleoprotein U-like protein 2 isoform X3 [Drosophila miranda]|uniref:heterogeneous nuclear ribonucleoprotein U-like protein 2 isoform X3 n=1 Tax=Drosophila miranda TaxID=7229 RepID=UPI0007E811CF|nr:heterogeneous nuclear ribonucleoprotein U-like protein 2 isoform X3 [Drosophila miranda]